MAGNLRAEQGRIKVEYKFLLEETFKLAVRAPNNIFSLVNL